MSDEDDVRVLVPRELITKQTDGRGRITLGSEYADKTVKVAVLEVEDE